MNDKQFEIHLRAAFPTPTATKSLDQKIDRAVDRQRVVRQVRRRVTFSLAGAAAVAVGIILVPPMKAQAAMNGMVQALNSKTSLKVISYTIDASRNQYPSAETIIAKGDTSYRELRGSRRQFDVGDASYGFDTTTKSFIKYPRRISHGIKLSDMLGSAGQFSLSKKVSIQRIKVDGKEVLRATIKNGDLPERYIIDADPETQLPTHMMVESLEFGKWRPRQNMIFEYREGLTVDLSELKKYPVLEKEAAEAKFNTAMTTNTLAAVPLKKGSLIVRAVEVADDGTVFVAYQSGQRAPNSWRGYGIILEDDLKTEYIRLGDLFYEGKDSVPADGKIEMEVFVPKKPISPTTARKIRLSAMLSSNGEFSRVVQGEIANPDGTRVKKWFSNNGDETKHVDLLTKSFSAPTCASAPSWAAGLDYTRFGNNIAAEMSKAEYRAKQAMEDKDWARAETLLNEQLRLLREHEAQGYGSWDMSRAMENLRTVQAKRRP